MEDITIVPLTPDRLDGFLGFFENSIPADE